MPITANPWFRNLNEKVSKNILWKQILSCEYTPREDISSCLPNILQMPFFYLVFDFNLKSTLAIFHHRTFIVKYLIHFL